MKAGEEKSENLVGTQKILGFSQGEQDMTSASQFHPGPLNGIAYLQKWGLRTQRKAYIPGIFSLSLPILYWLYYSWLSHSQIFQRSFSSKLWLLDLTSGARGSGDHFQASHSSLDELLSLLAFPSQRRPGKPQCATASLGGPTHSTPSSSPSSRCGDQKQRDRYIYQIKEC